MKRIFQDGVRKFINQSKMKKKLKKVADAANGYSMYATTVDKIDVEISWRNLLSMFLALIGFKKYRNLIHTSTNKVTLSCYAKKDSKETTLMFR